MPITNFRIRKMEAERKEGKVKKGKVDVNSNFSITSIKKDKDPTLGDYLQVNFKFGAKYKPEIGKIALEGELWYYTEDLEKVAKIKKKEIELKGEAANEVSTAILQRCVVEAVNIAKNIRLPIPMKLPKVNVKKGAVKFSKAS